MRARGAGEAREEARGRLADPRRGRAMNLLEVVALPRTARSIRASSASTAPSCAPSAFSTSRSGGSAAPSET